VEHELIKPTIVLRWVITLAWAVLIFYLSTRGFGPDFTARLLAWTFRILHLRVSLHTFDLLHLVLRKLAHVTEYAIFALLLYSLPGETNQAPWRSRRALLCILGAALFSLTDEFHQSFVPGRHASLLDCGLDTLGAALAMLIPYFQERTPSP
jgi:VanZ family protein